MWARAVLVGVVLGATSLAHYAIGVASHPEHVLHVSLELAYLLPVIAGAVWFGTRGGSSPAAPLLGAHALSSWRGQPMENANQLAMMLVFVVLGGVAGKLVDAERRATRDKVVEALAAKARSDFATSRPAGTVSAWRSSRCESAASSGSTLRAWRGSGSPPSSTISARSE